MTWQLAEHIALGFAVYWLAAAVLLGIGRSSPHNARAAFTRRDVWLMFGAAPLFLPIGIWVGMEEGGCALVRLFRRIMEGDPDMEKEDL